MADGVETLATPMLAAAVGAWTEFGTPSFPVTASDIRRWAIAVYWPERPPRLYWDEGYAGSTRWGGIIAPPEFNPFAWPVDRGSVREPRLYAPQPGEPGPHLLNGGRRLTVGVPVRPGDVIRSRSRVKGYEERHGRFGLMLYVEIERELVNQHDETARNTVDTIIRY